MDLMQRYFSPGVQSEGDRALEAHRELRRKFEEDGVVVTHHDGTTFKIKPRKMSGPTIEPVGGQFGFDLLVAARLAR